MIRNPIGSHKLSDINARNITWKQLYQHGNMTINFKLRVVQTQAILFLKLMSERVGSDIERQ